MTFLGVLQFFLILGALLLTTKPLGIYMTKVMDGERTVLSPLLSSLEKWIYRLCGVDPSEERSTKRLSTAAGSATLVSAHQHQDAAIPRRDMHG